MKLTLVADPMCSWCYGFGKEMTLLVERHPDIALELVMGGLRAGGTDVLDDAGKRFRLQHWARVEELSGLEFNRDGLMARQNFIYDTERFAVPLLPRAFWRRIATSSVCFALCSGHST
jgi:putative protein-disulfide isomerase